MLARLGPSPGPDDPDPGGCRARSDQADALVRELVTARGAGELLVLAVGGFGRRELAPRSDLDLLLVLPDAPSGGTQDRSARDAAAALVQALWDAGAELGHAVRTLEGVSEALARDLHAASALLEGRRLSGPEATWQALRARVGLWLARDGERFVAAKLCEAAERHRARGPQVGALSPDLKQGRGTLRDLQLLALLAALRADPGPEPGSQLGPQDAPAGQAGAGEDLVRPGLRDPLHTLAAAAGLEPAARAQLAADRALLLAARAALHELGPDERLDPQRQVLLAARFGYRDQGHRLAVEVFMDAIYRAAWRIDRLLRRESLPGPPPAPLPGADLPPRARARAIMGLFLAAQLGDQRLGLSVQEQVRAALRGPGGLAPDALRADPALAADLRRLLTPARGVAAPLRDMHEAGWLGALLPEVAALECLSQADPYHAWTVDEHTLAVMDALERPLATGQADGARGEPGAAGEREEQLRAALLARTDARDLLRLGVLLHDAGKVGGAVGHVERGAALVADAAARLGLAPREERHVRFLVAEHLSLSRLVDKQDVDAPATLEALLGLVDRDPLRLDHLYLLTCADVSGVSPTALTRWKDHLLTRLYERARAALAAPDAGPGQGARGDGAAGLLARLEGRGADPASLRAHLARCGRDYLTEVEPEEVLLHLELLAELEGQGAGPQACAVRCRDEAAAERVWVAARDRPGLFADLCGALSGAGYEILGARTLAREELVFDEFALHPVEAREQPAPARWARLEQALRGVLEGRVRAADLLAARVRRAPRDADGPSFPPPPVRVRISGESSPRTTLVDVSAPDRVGLLHDLARALTEAGCNIRLARVATKGNRAVDVFHVTDRAGAPLEAAACAGLEAALVRAARGAAP